MPINKPIEGNYTPVIKDIMYLSIALDKAWQQSPTLTTATPSNSAGITTSPPAPVVRMEA